MSEFLWGVSSSGYQSEGGFNGPGEPRNNWGDAEDEGRVERTGRAADFWNRYEEDFANARSMGLNAFRLSIEWPRVQPSSRLEAHEPPPFDLEALDGYADRIAACRRHGLEPVVTLQHFTHPAWLGVDAWLLDATAPLFETFVATSVQHINRRLVAVHGLAPVQFYVTLNEPNMLVVNTYFNRHFPGGGRAGFAAGVAAYSRVLAAHVRAYNAIHDVYEAEGWTTPMVTMNTFCSDAYWSEKILLDLLLVRERGITAEGLKDYLRDGSRRLSKALLSVNLPFRKDPYVWLGRVFHYVIDVFAPKHAIGETFKYFLDTLAASKRACVLDYLGLDYYDPFTGHLFRPPSFADLEFKSKTVHGRLVDSLASKWWDWHVLPEGLHFFCEYYWKEFQRPILIAENGMSLRRKVDNSPGHPRRDKLTRSEFLIAHLKQVKRLREDGVPMLGYMHWSITDNYEWGSYTPRFGLYTIDYTRNSERLPVDYLGDRPSETYRRLVAEARTTADTPPSPATSLP